ncbi:hypothetical protein [Terriglobus roseus]|uniref:Uncharacterized protein n=1 Tax=Terriglobus roseus TaxID=392734 RepID=A0A1H4K1W7_9BACT|nr:hypothetical protein [Terriglobus roseus]SEB52393.1 hypothetical protein SAMN05443244_0953 [Terriglobus roseus]
MKQLRLLLALLALLALPAGLRARGQQPQNQNSVTQFFQQSAKFIYNLAWPTATYSDFGLRGIEPVQGGFDVKILLDGRSGFDNSDLWILLRIKIRRNGIADIVVLNDNHFLMAPFATSTAVGQAVVQLSQRYAESQPSSAAVKTPPVQNQLPATPSPSTVSQAVCIENRTGNPVPLLYRWGDQDWASDSLPAAGSHIYYWNSATSPPFFVRYDADFAEGLQLKTYELNHKTAAANPDCASSQRYQFSIQGNGIEVYAE